MSMTTKRWSLTAEKLHLFVTQYVSINYEDSKKEKKTKRDLMRVGFEPTRVAPLGICVKVTLT